MTERHLFALFYPACSTYRSVIRPGQEIEISDEKLFHRLIRVLRLLEQQECILFDRFAHARVKIKRIMHQKVYVELVEYADNTPLKPFITLCIPLLKRDALHDAMYAAVELGASQIQLIKTEKMHKQLAQHELERLDKIIIAAAEQSKNFHFPIIHAAKDLSAYVLSNKDHWQGIWFCAEGIPLTRFFRQEGDVEEKQYALFFGPEADFSLKEKLFFEEIFGKGYRLTPTILRSPQAVSVGLGIFRTMLS